MLDVKGSGTMMACNILLKDMSSRVGKDCHWILPQSFIDWFDIVHTTFHFC